MKVPIQDSPHNTLNITKKWDFLLPTFYFISHM